MYILGISCYYHDSAACLLKDGVIVAAAQEERFTRKKHDHDLPVKAVQYCLKEAGIEINDLDYLGFYDKPFTKFERILQTSLATFPRSLPSFIKAIPIWLHQKLWIPQEIENQLGYGKNAAFKSRFGDEDLVVGLLKKKIVKKNKANPELVFFNDSIGSETELKELLSNAGLDSVEKVTKVWQESQKEGQILFAQHHQSHAASAFYASGYEEAAVLTLDGVGEWDTATYGVGKGCDLEIIKSIKFPHSLGLLYSAFTYYLGFKVNSAEYKVMGLAPYGKPKYVDVIKEELIHINDDGSFWMNMKYFAYDYGLTMTNRHFDKLFGGPPRKGETKLEQKQMDLAASVQKVTEEIVIKMACDLYEKTGQKNLCLAGGVALNCVANGKIIKETPYKEIFVQPAAGDAGGAYGVAALIYHHILKKKRTPAITHSYFGPEFSREEIKRYLDDNQVKYHLIEDRGELLKKVAQLIDGQGVIGWFQGRMEFGPRALGNRSIIADARNPENKEVVNLKIKFRESFRPFAPSVLEERASEYFELEVPSRYMLLVAQVRENRRTIPSVTHVDGSARIQTVTPAYNEMFYQLIKEFDNLTGCPVIINTSFNVRGEPIVCSPHDAYMCFMRTDMDYLVMEHFFLDKKEMKPLEDDIDWQNLFELD